MKNNHIEIIYLKNFEKRMQELLDNDRLVINIADESEQRNEGISSK